MNVLISSCFLLPTRYDGNMQTSSEIQLVVDVLKLHNVNIIPICPEQLGGLPTPRPPAEIVGDHVYDVDGKDVSEQFQVGAQRVLSVVKQLDIDFVILKENSPSCGVHQIYDGSFSKVKIPGLGITSKHLTEAGIKVYSEVDLLEIKELLCK